jgi:hypothetical protein
MKVDIEYRTRGDLAGYHVIRVEAPNGVTGWFPVKVSSKEELDEATEYFVGYLGFYAGVMENCPPKPTAPWY